MTETEKTKYQAILRIAYLLAAADGEVRPDEREAFKRTLHVIEGFEFGDPSTTAFIESVVEDGKKLAMLRDFYNDDEMIRAFMEKVAKDVIAIKDDTLFLRRGFACWISISLADKDFSQFEEKIINGLQCTCNGLQEELIKPIAAVPGIAGALAGLVGGVAAVGGIALATPVAVAYILGKMALSDKKAFGPEARISDEYLAEVRSRCVAIDDLNSQIESCKSEDAKKSLEGSLGYLVESLKDYIHDFEEK